MEDGAKAHQTISEQEFVELCAATWAEPQTRLGCRVTKGSPALHLLSEILKGLRKHFAIDPDHLDRRNPKLKIRELLSERAQPPFEYERITDRYVVKVAQQYGIGMPAKKLLNRSRRKRNGGHGKPNPFRK
jgi:hypothetical protein